MSDERLREAERKWRETGSVDDEARYLLERVRVGDLTEGRVRLAALSGNEGARAALGAGRNSWSSIDELRDWGKGAVVAAAAGAAGFAIGRVAEASATLSRIPIDALAAVWVWLSTPLATDENRFTSLARTTATSDWCNHRWPVSSAALSVGECCLAVASSDEQVASAQYPLRSESRPQLQYVLHASEALLLASRTRGASRQLADAPPELLEGASRAMASAVVRYALKTSAPRAGPL
jgi:hypothetical protein